MANDIQLTIRTATRDRKNNLTVSTDTTVKELLESAREQWNLSSQYEYILRSEKLGIQLQENQTLAQAGIQDDDTLEIAGLSDAG